MRATTVQNGTFPCPDTASNPTANSGCTLAQLCGLSAFPRDGSPDQWYRFITPIFIHGGIVHLAFNLLAQLSIGIHFERDVGWWRTGIIYMFSGIGGNIFGANLASILQRLCMLRRAVL